MSIANKGIFLGQEATLSLSDDGGATYKLWGCCQSMTYSEETEFLEKTPIDSDWISVIPTYSRGNVDVNGLYLISDSDNQTHLARQLFQWRRDKQLLDFKVVFGNGGDIYTGQCYIQAVKGLGNVDEFASINMQLIIAETGYTYQQAQLGCPLVINVDSTLDSLTFEFTADTDATSYVFELFEGNVLADSKVVSPPYSTPQQVIFTGLDTNIIYGLVVTVNNTADLFTKQCPRDNFPTDDITCPNVTRSSGDNTINYSFSDTGQGVTQWQMVLKQGTTTIDTDTYTPPYSNPIAAQFAGLTINTAYTLSLVGSFAGYSKTCGPYSISTTGGPTGYPYLVGLGVTSGQACVRSLEPDTQQTVYSPASSFQVNMFLFEDAAMTIPLTGSSFIVEVGEGRIYQLDSGTGEVTVDTGNFC